ncbi:hypothetical protein AOLI_G00216160 [Acnodon oligacanthus]
MAARAPPFACIRYGNAMTVVDGDWTRRGEEGGVRIEVIPRAGDSGQQCEGKHCFLNEATSVEESDLIQVEFIHSQVSSVKMG